MRTLVSTHSGGEGVCCGVSVRRLWWAFLRLFFRLLYNELAWTYDLVAWAVSVGQWRAWGRTALRHVRGQRVLELAHGPGHLLVAMVGRGLDPVGLDVSPAMGQLARRRLKGNQVSAPLVRARAQAIPFRDRSFDSAVATFPTEFILDPGTLGETARVLRGGAHSPEPTGARARPERTEAVFPDSESSTLGGRLVVVASARLGKRDLLSRLIGWLYRVTGQGEPIPGEDHMAVVRRWFTTQVVLESVGSTDVTLVVAEKREHVRASTRGIACSLAGSMVE
jgi:ubiquinone/menaquinone biosynthesis C-methylase UbiE